MIDNLKNCVANSLDGYNPEIFPFLPYILQDILEIGTDPEVMLELILEFVKIENPKILDVCCGKGVVSIKIAKEINAQIKGIDAVPQFIDEAEKYAKLHNVEAKCNFVVGDVRMLIASEKDYDIVVLGAIGNVLGVLKETLSKVSEILKPGGYVLLDDGFLPDKSALNYNRCHRESEFYEHIKSARFFITKEIIFNEQQINSSDMVIFDGIVKRSKELMNKYPEKKELFQEYIKNQEFENYMHEKELVTGIWLLQKNH